MTTVTCQPFVAETGHYSSTMRALRSPFRDCISLANLWRDLDICSRRRSGKRMYGSGRNGICRICDASGAAQSGLQCYFLWAPTRTRLAQPNWDIPETFSGTLAILNHDFDLGGMAGTVFGANSAGIEIRGFAHANSVLNNRIRGRANAAMTVLDQSGGMPGNNSFVANDLNGFQSSLADIFIDAGVTNTFVIGRQASIEDRGSGTIVVPMR
jgi:hypothetical protein